ncbi:c-type cytochrome [Parvicella tangerina]|uniref:Cytochrome c domain-containing protein n=1 Tax=Parvicella tangerina TaxID=2829795 RepID=A0A916NA17_9FLAO|nr:c-type cytochrome [Parvicella tangerina]CAG5078330.1 hypothetical protein CRYO30217_00643 [Parvicella tangerina]
MRKELELIKIIEKYLFGELKGDDLKRFEANLAKSATLQDEVEKQRLVMEGVKNVSVRSKVKKAKKSFKINKWGWNGLIAIITAGVVAAGIYGYDAFFGDNTTSENIKYELNEEGTTLWSEADEMIAPQFYTVNNDEGTVLQTDAGMIIAIPDGAFLDELGNPVAGYIELEVKEALDGESIMLAGLSTKSGDDLLETGGMFYLNGRKDGKTLKMNPDQPIIVEVPTDEVKLGMELYHGVRKEDGGLDWQDPKPIEQFLIPVDIHSLNLYPPKYEQGLASLGYGSEGKQWKDSVYYSFGGFGASEGYQTIPTVLHPSGHIPNRAPKGWELDTLGYDPFEDETLIADGINEEEAIKLGYYRVDTMWGGALEINPSKVQAFWNDEFQNTLLATKEFEERMPFIHCVAKDKVLDLYVHNLDKKMSTVDSMVVDYLGGIEGSWGEPTVADVASDIEHGKLLFQANCASCHKTVSYSTGPPMAGSKMRWEAFGEGELVYEWIRDNGALRSSGKSKAAESVFNQYNGSAMTSFPTLSNEDIDDIFAYAEWDALNVLKEAKDWKDLNEAYLIVLEETGYEFAPEEDSEVSEESDLSYEGTEELDICLDCDIEQLKAKFAEFALQNKGRVEMSLKAVKMLKKYYEKHAKVYAKAAEKVQKNFQKELTNATNKYNKEKNAKVYEDIVREGQNLTEEIDKNLDETYKQLGIPRPKVQINPKGPKYTIPITNAGWNNIDRKVIEGTIARETINVEYEGKTAEIKYESVNVEVVDRDAYDKVFVYLLPHELSSFQRITKRTEKGAYTENLNEFFQYDLVVVGYKGKAIYLGREQNVQSQSYTMKIVETDKGDLKSVLHHTGKKSYRNSLVDDMLDQQSLMLQEAVVNKMEDIVAFRQEMMDYIFNCNSFATSVMTDSVGVSHAM